MSGEQQCYILGWTGWKVSKMWDQTPRNLNFLDENITSWFLLPWGPRCRSFPWYCQGLVSSLADQWRISQTRFHNPGSKLNTVDQGLYDDWWIFIRPFRKNLTICLWIKKWKWFLHQACEWWCSSVLFPFHSADLGIGCQASNTLCYSHKTWTAQSHQTTWQS